MSVTQLVNLDDDEFSDEVSMRLNFDNEGWPELLDPELLHRTGEVLEELQVKVDMQLVSHAGQDRGDGWERKAINFQKLVGFRLRQVRRLIGAERNTPDARAAKAWRAVLHDVAEALEESNRAFELDDIEIPFDGLTVRSWLQRRREKRGLAA